LKYLIATFILAFSFYISIAQSIPDSVKVEDEVPGGLHMYCKDLKKMTRTNTYTRVDSLSNCIISKTFKTDHIDLYYIKEFDLNGKIRDEGYAKGVWIPRWFLGIRLQSKVHAIQKDGAWRFYDDLGYKISDCCYKNGKICNGCIWVEYDKQGYELKEYKIGW
jgi:hypothetical protein